MKNWLIGLGVLFTIFLPIKSRADGVIGWILQPGVIYYFTTEGENPNSSSTTTVTRELADRFDD